MTRVKICGLMNQNDVNLCVEAGVDMLGFVVDYPVEVPWNLTTDKARELISKVSPFVSTCIVTGGSVEKVSKLVEETNPNVVQLHYKETLKEVTEIASRLQLRGVKTMKALRIDQNGKCDFDFSDPVLAVRELCKTGIAAILVDAYTESMPGGTGVMIDLQMYQTLQKESSLPLVLAGGLNPSNIGQIVGELNPDAVDVLTGVEQKPNQKDPHKVVEFIRNVHLR